MFLINRNGGLNTIEIVMIILITLIAVAVPMYKLMGTFGNRLNEMREAIGN